MDFFKGSVVILIKRIFLKQVFLPLIDRGDPVGAVPGNIFPVALLAVVTDLLPQGQKGPGGAQTREGGVRRGQPDHKTSVIFGGNLQGIGVAVQDLLIARDIFHQVVAVEGLSRGLRDLAEHLFKILGSHGFAVRPLQVVPKVEGPFQAVVGHLPLLRAARNRSPVLIQNDQALADQSEQAGGICVHDLGGNRIPGLTGQTDADHTLSVFFFSDGCSSSGRGGGRGGSGAVGGSNGCGCSAVGGGRCGGCSAVCGRGGCS